MLHWACDYLFMLGLKLNHRIKSGHRTRRAITWTTNGLLLIGPLIDISEIPIKDEDFFYDFGML